MDFEQACDELCVLLQKSNGKPIPFDGAEEYFLPIKKYKEHDIREFENKYNIELPSTYCYFLQKVGACELYRNSQYGGGFEVIELEKIERWAQKYGEVYHHKFPMLLIAVNHFSMGDAGAFDLKEGNKFSIVPHDESLLEYMGWKDGWSSFEEWIVKCVSSLGNDSL